MNILTQLTQRHLKMNRKRTVMTIIGIVLSVAIVTAISGFIVSFQDLLYRDTVARDGLWHVQYSGVTEDVAEEILLNPTFSVGEVIQTENGPVLSLLFTKVDKNLFDRSEEVCQQYGFSSEQVRYNTSLLIAEGVVPGAYYRAVYSFAAVLLTLVAIGSVLVISNAFTISIDQRSRQFGMLKSVGATKEQIRNMVLLEGLILAVCAIPLGIIAGLGIQWVALTIANTVLSRMDAVNLEAWFRVVLSPVTILAAVVAALVTVLLSAWRPAQRASKVSAIDSIRLTQTIKLSTKNVRVSPLAGKFFGFEGMLAAKTLRRNRSKYRPTILSMVISTVLFIGVSSFAGILIKATSMIYQDYGSNVRIVLNPAPMEQHEAIIEEMGTWDGVELYPIRRLYGEISLSEGALPVDALTQPYKEHFAEAVPTIQMYSIGEERYAELCRKLSISTQQMEEGYIGGILINTSDTVVQSGRRSNFVPYRLPIKTQFPVQSQQGELTVEVVATIDEVLPGINYFFDASHLNLIVPDTVYASFQEESAHYVTCLAVQATDSVVFTQRATALLEEQLEPGGWSLTDFEAAASTRRNLIALVMLFVYGFIFMLSLMGITSVITTISTNITLRRREFAMLQSTGMTEEAMGRMLRYESLFYGIRALMWGIPLGFAVSVLLYQSMTSAMDFPFIWPIPSTIIATIVVLLISFSTMTFARRKQRQINIIDALRHDA